MAPIKTEQLQYVVTQDPVLSRVLNYIAHGWLSTVDTKLIPFCCRQEQLTSEAGYILCGVRGYVS